MYLIGLTGGIASGKSAVSKRLAEHGAVVVDADALAREVVEPGAPALGAIVDHFGPGVIDSDGRLDRSALGAIVFSRPEERAVLNAISHPAVWARAVELIAEAKAKDPHAVVVYDVPLLAEASTDRPLRFDLVVVVHADTEERIRRMVDLRGMSREEAVHRLNSQATDAERLALADVVINNGGSLEQLLAQVDELWVAVRGRA